MATGRRPGIARLAQTSRISETLDTGSGTRQPGNPCSDEHGIELNAAVESIMRMPVEERRTALLLDIVSPELQTRLAKWCDNGEYARAVDSPEYLQSTAS